MAKTIITYGTFDLFHIGHLNLLKRLRALGDRLVVGVSTDEFNAIKGKKTIISFEHRLEIVKSIKFVDIAFAENCWEQKIEDIKKYEANVFAMGNDWEGKFDYLKAHCEVAYLDRTEGISTTELKNVLSAFKGEKFNQLQEALETLNQIVKQLS